MVDMMTAIERGGVEEEEEKGEGGEGQEVGQRGGWRAEFPRWTEQPWLEEEG